MDDNPDSLLQEMISEHPNDVPTTWMDSEDFEASKWLDNSNGDDWGMDPDTVEHPQIGPGVFPRRWVQIAHPHEIFQPRLKEIPKVQAAVEESQKDELLYSVNDVWGACPGGVDAHHEWFFCLTCGGWLRIISGQGALPEVDESRASEARGIEYSRYQDLQASRSLAQDTHHHLHEFTTLIDPTTEMPIDRIDAGDDLNAFPHATFGIEDDSPAASAPETPARLYASCSSDLWMIVDKGVIPGQLPTDLVRRFNAEKHGNPNPGTTPNESVKEAWELLSTYA